MTLFFLFEFLYVYYKNTYMIQANSGHSNIQQMSPISNNNSSHNTTNFVSSTISTFNIFVSSIYWPWWGVTDPLVGPLSDPLDLTTATSSLSSSTNFITSEYKSILYKVFSHKAWSNWSFIISFFITAAMGSVLNYSIFLCTTLNSALTTGVIGCLKNVATSYIGMIVFSDYKFIVYFHY